MSVIKVTKENFDEVVMKSDKPVIIDFWATWCGPCKMFSPVVDEIGNETDKAVVCKINVDDEPEITQKFGISSIPTVVVVKNGKTVKSAVGARSKSEVLAMIE